MRKNAKKILVGAVLILTLAIFTACGSSNNADEVEKENNKTTEENVAENGERTVNKTTVKVKHK